LCKYGKSPAPNPLSIELLHLLGTEYESQPSWHTIIIVDSHTLQTHTSIALYLTSTDMTNENTHVFSLFPSFSLSLISHSQLLIGIRVYTAAGTGAKLAQAAIQKQRKFAHPNPAAATAAAAAAEAALAKLAANPPPPIPDLYLQSRTVFCPPILLRYRDMCESFGDTAEIRLLRSCLGLLQMAANLSQRLADAFGPSAPKVAKQLFQAAWGANIISEFTAVVHIYTKQKPLAVTAAKLLLQIKKQMKVVIAL
jgi:hypothetical protein